MAQVHCKLTDGREFDVTTSLADVLAWETYAISHQIPQWEAGLNMTVHSAYTAARRAGAIDPGMPYDAFVAVLEGIPQTVEADVEVDPTQPVAGTASPSKSPRKRASATTPS